MVYALIIDPRALNDIQDAIHYYDEKKAGLGKRFESALNKHLEILESNPFFRVRYGEVRCLPLINFPFMIHFTVNEKQKVVTIRAVFHTSLEPKKWQRKNPEL
jgi:hypothetical protein